jgi:hypothetical protein
MTAAEGGVLDGDPNSWVEPSRVRLAVVPSVGEFLEWLGGRVASGSDDTRLVAVVFDRLPALDPLIETVVAKLADVALALWPDWYSGVIPFPEVNRSTFAFEDRLSEAFHAAGPLRHPPSVAWVKEARRLAEGGRPPLVPGMPRAVEAAQLAMAVGPRKLFFALGVTDEGVAGGRMLGLSRAAEWLGRTSGARVLVVVPEPVSRSAALDGINFDPLPAPRFPEPAPWPSLAGAAVGVWPVIGRPHPYSPGEQLLAKRLAEDAMVGGSSSSTSGCRPGSTAGSSSIFSGQRAV